MRQTGDGVGQSTGVVAHSPSKEDWLPELYRVKILIVKLLTQHGVKGDFWVPTNGNLPCWWWGYQSAICVHDWFEMGCPFSPSLIKLGLQHESGKSFHTLPPSLAIKCYL